MYICKHSAMTFVTTYSSSNYYDNKHRKYNSHIRRHSPDKTAENRTKTKKKLHPSAQLTESKGLEPSGDEWFPPVPVY